MMSRLRFITVSAAGLLCLWCCSAAHSSDLAQAASAASQTSVAPDVAVLPGDSVVVIPGPLRSFLRMAGISQKIPLEDVLPLLARNASMRGYSVNGKPTESWILLAHYVQQARELQIVAGATETIRVTKCEDAGPLLRILGYKLRQGCNPKNIALVTDVPERAFLTLDSGFPLTDFEEALQNGVPFVDAFHASRVPALFKESDWLALATGKKSDSRNLLNLILHDPVVPRLYWALSKNDFETRFELKRSPGLKRLLPHATVLDFYGDEISIRAGRVIVPGKTAAESAWKEVVGESPASPGNFVLRLVSKDDGWLAAYFDVLSRISQKQQEHFTQLPRLQNLYEAFRMADPQSRATSGAFRKAPELLVLFTDIKWEANGDPHVPGNLNIWKEILYQKTDSKIIREWEKTSHNWDHPDELLEAITAFSRIDSDTGPLPTYLMLNEIDSRRSSQERLSPTTVRLLAKRFSEFNSWYLIFTEFPDLNDVSIASFIEVADAIDKIPNQTLRANVLGTLQANIGLWQIFCRQSQIAKDQQNASWQSIIRSFSKVTSSNQLFDATRGSLGDLLFAVTGKAGYSQDELIDLLAGPHQDTPDGQRMHLEMAAKIRSVLEDQRLVSLDTLSELSDGLHEMARGGAAGDDLLSLAGELREFEMPRPLASGGDRASWAPPVYSSRHAELQVRTDLTKIIKTPGSRVQLEAARGQLAPFLRDTLVGLNYAYYEPPGAQMLHHNPLFIRAHDFSGVAYTGAPGRWSAPDLVGAGATAGGGAYLMGSLSNLPYALAKAEQNFLVSENIQALIWKELVPKLLVDATMSRWWGINAHELHAVTLYQKSGEELLAASANNEELRAKVVAILSDCMTPKRLEWAQQNTVSAEEMAALLSQMMPADTFYLTAEFRKRFPAEAASWGAAGKELENLTRQHTEDVNPERLSTDFGVSHPTLSATYSRDLLTVKPLYSSGGYSSRLFGESWESSNLYWARLADEMGYSPVMLNRLVPELTQHMITKIFASDLDDWQALLRAMDETGNDFRHSTLSTAPATSAVAQN